MRSSINRRITRVLVFVFAAALPLGAQKPAEKPAWEVELAADKRAPSTVTVLNRCKGRHSFEVSTSNLPFMSFPKGTTVKVKGGQTEVLPVLFDTTGLASGLHIGEFVVLCVSCANEPTCTQDRDTFPVKLTVPASPTAPTVAASSSEDDPCAKPPRECEELRQAAWQKEAEAAGAEMVARTARQEADRLETEAARLEAEHKKKAAEAKDPGPGDSYIEDAETGRRVTSRDLELKRAAMRAAWGKYKAGDLTAKELEETWDDLSDAEALEELRKKDREERAKKQKEADALKKKADTARTAADAVGAAATAAEATARSAREAAQEARRRYEECMKKWREKCKKLAEERRRQEEERRKKAADAAAAAAEAERQAQLAEQRRKAAEAARQKRLAHNRYLLENIRDLGLISHPGFWETPGIWDWLPDAIERPVGDFLEDQTGGVIPTDAIKAIGGLYGIAAALLNPCVSGGQGRTALRLTERKNPKTGSNYTLNEALKKTEEMCRMLRRLKARAEAAKQRGN